MVLGVEQIVPFPLRTRSVPPGGKTLDLVSWRMVLRAEGSGVERGAAGSSSRMFHWVLWLPATPVTCTLVCPHTATLGCPRRRSAVLGGPLLEGPLASDGAARSLATMGPVRLPSGSESSSIGGSRILGMTIQSKTRSSSAASGAEISWRRVSRCQCPPQGLGQAPRATAKG